MSRSIQLYLHDALAAITDILDFTVAYDVDRYLGDRLLRAAVERKFEIIGEALGNVRRLGPDLAATITDLRRAIAFRNVIIHSDMDIDDLIVWSTLKEKLPGMQERLQLLLAERS